MSVKIEISMSSNIINMGTCQSDYSKIDKLEYFDRIEVTIRNGNNYKIFRDIEFVNYCEYSSINKIDKFTLFIAKENINIIYNYERMNILHYVCKYTPNYNLIQTLINYGVNINKCDRYGNSPLLTLCYYNGDKTELIKLLVESKCNVFQTNDKEKDCVSILKRIQSGNTEAIKYLVKKQQEALA